MKNRNTYVFSMLFALIAIAFLCGASISGTAKTITGKVNDNYQIVTDDGLIYEVEGNEKGDEVIALVGKQVKATGMIDENEEIKTITITTYELISE